jgi:hypothetical protein
MKSIFFAATLLLAFSVSAQAPVAVPIPQEPHHHLVLENDYVRVFRVSVPAHESTLLHQHDVPYLYVSLGPADVINAVQGKPEAHLVMVDGQLGYSPGHFAHIARNDSDLPFNNVTIELLKPQKNPHNICREVIPGAVRDCSGPPITRIPDFPDKGLPLFETGEVFVQEVYIPKRPNHAGLLEGPDVLLVALANPNLKLRVPGQPSVKLATGAVTWLTAGQKCSISAPRGVPLHFLLLTFSDGTAVARP